jgi:hypothetical protein
MGNKHPLTLPTQTTNLTKEQILYNKQEYIKHLHSQRVYISTRRRMVIEYFNIQNYIPLQNQIVKSNLSKRLESNSILNLAWNLASGIRKASLNKQLNVNIYESMDVVVNQNTFEKLFESGDSTNTSIDVSKFKRDPEKHRKALGTGNSNTTNNVTLESQKSFASTNSTLVKRNRTMNNSKHDIRSIDTSKMRERRDYFSKVSFISEL